VPARASIEAAARDARYAALGAIVDDIGAIAMWTAHTARDQAETVMMRIVRGTGPAGLGGIAADRSPFARPLLALPRAAIDAYVAARALPVWDDPMNADDRFARVRMRRDVLPALRRENPALDDALCRLAASAAEWTAAIDAVAAPLAVAPIGCARLATQPAAIRKRALAIAVEHAGLGYDTAHLERLDALVSGPARGERAIDVPGGRAVRRYDVLTFEPEGDRDRGPRTSDALLAPAGYSLRVVAPGDRMKPIRLKGRSRKLSDLFVDAKVPREARRTARVLVRVSTGAIAWAEHLGVAHGEPADRVPTVAAEPARSGRSF
jgi:tRNA(Ile)-lysidine synthase